MFNTEQLQEKWQPVLEHADLPEIKDAYKRAVTTVILENQNQVCFLKPKLNTTSIWKILG